MFSRLPGSQATRSTPGTQSRCRTKSWQYLSCIAPFGLIHVVPAYTMPEVRCVDARGRREPKSALRGTNCAALAQRLRPREQSVAYGGRRSDPVVNPKVVRHRRSFRHRAWALQISDLPTPSTPHDSGKQSSSAAPNAANIMCQHADERPPRARRRITAPNLS